VVDGRRFGNKSNPKGGSMWWVETIDLKPAAASVVETENVVEFQDHRNEPRF